MDYKLNEHCRVDISKGCQVKYFSRGYWYKIDTYNRESVNERIASLLLKCSNITNCVSYEICSVNGKPACRSKNFIGEYEQLFTFDDIIRRMCKAVNAHDWLISVGEPRERFNALVDVVNSFTYGKIDCRDYLKQVLYFDMLILNRDRHLENLAVLHDLKTGKFRMAPVFDHGLSMCAGLRGSILETGIERTVFSQSAKTLGAGFVTQCRACTPNGELKTDIEIDFVKFRELADKEGLTNTLSMQALEFMIAQCGSIYGFKGWYII